MKIDEECGMYDRGVAKGGGLKSYLCPNWIATTLSPLTVERVSVPVPRVVEWSVAGLLSFTETEKIEREKMCSATVGATHWLGRRGTAPLNAVVSFPLGLRKKSWNWVFAAEILSPVDQWCWTIVGCWGIKTRRIAKILRHTPAQCTHSLLCVIGLFPWNYFPQSAHVHSMYSTYSTSCMVPILRAAMHCVVDVDKFWYRLAP